MVWLTSQEMMAASRLDGLSDDILRSVIGHLPSYNHRQMLARTAQRFATVVRAQETMYIEMTSGTWVLHGVGCEEPCIVNGKPTSPISIDVDACTLHTFSERLRWALNMVLLAFRKSMSALEISSLRLHQRKDIPAILPGLSFFLVGAAMQVPGVVHSNRHAGLRELTMTYCVLPSNLALMIPHVQRLRLWDCVVEWSPAASGSSAETVHGQRAFLAASVLGLAALRELVWGGETRPAPPELLLESPRTEVDGRARLEVLVLSTDKMQGLSSDEPGQPYGSEEGEGHPPWGRQLAAEDAGGCGALWRLAGGGELRELVLLQKEGEDLSPSAAASLLFTLRGAWHRTLRVLHLPADSLCALADASRLPLGGGQHRLFDMLPPGLETLGAVSCSWLSPSWFFNALAEHNAAASAGAVSRVAGQADGSHRALRRLQTLTVFINSPGASGGEALNFMGTAAGGTAAFSAATSALEVWPSATFEPGCALHRMAQGVAETLPWLQRLNIIWYDEDGLGDAAGVARALAPLGKCAGLRELFLMRDDENCGGSPSETELPCMLRAVREVLPGVLRVSAWHTPEQSQADRPVWEVEDRVGMLQGGSGCTCRLAPRRHHH